MKESDIIGAGHTPAPVAVGGDVVERVIAAIKNLPMWDGDTVGMNLTRDELGDIARTALAAMPVKAPVADDVRELVEQFAQDLERGDFDSVKFALNQRMCCDGHMCGCRGSSVGEYLAYEARDLITRLASQPPAEAAIRADERYHVDLYDERGLLDHNGEVNTLKELADLAQGRFIAIRSRGDA